MENGSNIFNMNKMMVEAVRASKQINVALLYYTQFGKENFQFA